MTIVVGLTSEGSMTIEDMCNGWRTGATVGLLEAGTAVAAKLICTQASPSRVVRPDGAESLTQWWAG